MHILVFSDSHGSSARMREMIGRESPDFVLHLGDGARDFVDVMEEFPAIPHEQVCGNCDFLSAFSPERVLELDGVRILMMHGHTCGVKSGSARAVSRAKEQGAQILLFGHTHRAECRLDGGLWVMNPGSIGKFGPYTCGQIFLEKGRIECRILPVDR